MINTKIISIILLAILIITGGFIINNIINIENNKDLKNINENLIEQEAINISSTISILQCERKIFNLNPIIIDQNLNN